MFIVQLTWEQLETLKHVIARDQGYIRTCYDDQSEVVAEYNKLLDALEAAVDDRTGIIEDALDAAKEE
jgi:hypothetical protein